MAFKNTNAFFNLTNLTSTMYRSATILLLSIALLSNNLLAQEAESETKTLVTKVLETLKKAKGYSYLMKGTERIPGKAEFRVTEVLTKVNVTPKKIYTKVLSSPNKGTEMLYVSGERDNKLLVKAGILPSLKLSPLSSLLTKEQHHSVLSSGFMFFYKLVSEGVKRADEKNEFNTVFKLAGEVTFDGKKCYKLIIEDPTYALISYKGVKGENPYSISQKLLIPEFSTREINNIKYLDEDLEGKTIKIPTSYAKKSVIYIDKNTFYPIYQEMTDSKGVFEKYEFTNLKISPTFAADEFTDDFGEYNF